MYTSTWSRFRTLLPITVFVSLLLLTPVQAQSNQPGTPGGTTILLPSIQGGYVAAPPQLPEENGPVFGLLGSLQAAQGRSFSTYLIVASPGVENGLRIGLAGETPDVETRIIALRDQQPDEQVKVWGAYLAPQGSADRTADRGVGYPAGKCDCAGRRSADGCRQI